MKNHLVLNNLPTYDDGTTINLNRINLFFGKNGSGKSTLCNYIERNPNLIIENQEELIVFNKEYKKTQIIDGMKGIYTFGKDDSEIINEINLKRKVIDEKNGFKEKEQEKKRNTDEQRKNQHNLFEEDIWNYKKEKVDKYLGVELFKGYNKSKEKFADKLLDIFEDYSQKQYDESEIDYYYELVKNNNEEKYAIHPQLELKNMDEIKGFQLLSKSIISHSENDLNKYYSKLNNIKWIRDGRTYVTEDNLCPFCQTKLDKQFYKEFKAIFDDVYEEEISELSSFIDQYDAYLNKVSDQIESILFGKCNKIDYTSLEEHAKSIKLSIKTNKEELEKKKTDPSITITIDDFSDEIMLFNQCIGVINDRIEQYNDDITKKKEIPNRMTELLWIKLSKDLYRRCNSFKKCDENLSNQYDDHNKNVSAIEEEIIVLENEIQEKMSLITNIENTVLEINNLLSNFGFNTFQLDINDDFPGTYRIKRPKGVGSVDTLSEGEYNLVAFLYLYRLVYGSLDVNNDGKTIVLVIDDPVSSMDGDTMGIISTLTKKIIDDCIKRKSRIEQLLIFTHNVFYYKEIEYRSKNDKENVSYHNIIKNEQNSVVETSNNSKIHSNYEQLWMEYKRSSSPVSTLNCMRRIMEYYFKSLIGADNYNEIRSKFNESDMILFDGLTNMLNSGSHSIFDPIDIYLDDSTIERYKVIFKKIFDVSGNLAHFNYMSSLVP